MLETVGSPMMWLGFTGFVILMLALDLGVFHRKAHEVSVKESFIWTMVWIGLALVFNVYVYYEFGPQRGMEYLTGYLVEKALSIDNIFVILVTFTFFQIPKLYQHRVLFWGILGALVFRAIFIFLGAIIVQKFHWVMYFFGAVLMFTAYKLMVQKDNDMRPDENVVYRLMRKFIPSTDEMHGEKFFVNKAGKWVATPLFLTLLVVEISDIIFAVESIPAIFAITNDPFIVYTSNIFAILGMRSLYFLLAGVMTKFHYLKYGLSLVLGFVGLKILAASFYKIPILVSLGVIAGILSLAIIFSLLRDRQKTSLQS